MYVCLCHGITERQVREAAVEGCASVADLGARTGLGTCCGSCTPIASEILEEVRGERAFPLPLLAVA